ncbi:hypothetical protein EVAR_66983_1 [Eumeta japonica]|uniref:Uncharacterized protein n=1 Tax=Eumeta variegata TaxID=151549 RepID=A0A4C1ZS99_EUMVA|nr:hypothetical protein EVAR_66983_1 [Eumeta japonica]
MCLPTLSSVSTDPPANRNGLLEPRARTANKTRRPVVALEETEITTVYAFKRLSRAPGLALCADVVSRNGHHFSVCSLQAFQVTVSQTARTLCERGLVPNRAQLERYIYITGL